jgi:hypothetical protein
LASPNHCHNNNSLIDKCAAYVCVRDGQGNVLDRMQSRHVHGVGVESRDDTYAGLTHGAQRRQVRAKRLSASAPIVTGTAFIFASDPY